MSQQVVAPHIRAWVQEEQQRTVSGFYGRQAAKPRRLSLHVLVAVVLALVGAMTMDAYHRQQVIASRLVAGKSADLVMLAAHGSQERLIRRELDKISGVNQ